MSPRSLLLACLLALFALTACRHTPTGAQTAAADAPRQPFSDTPAFPGWIAACGDGDAGSCSAILSSIFFSGRTELLEESEAAFARACEAGVADGCTGAILSRLSEEEPALDAEGLRRACEQGSRFACLMELPMQFQASQDPEALTALIEEQASECEAEGGLRCSLVSSAYETGTGVEPDAARALKLAQKGCELQEPMSCYQLGLLYASAPQGAPQGSSSVEGVREDADTGSADADGATAAADGTSEPREGGGAEASLPSGEPETGAARNGEATAEADGPPDEEEEAVAGASAEGEMAGQPPAQQAVLARDAFLKACEGQVGPACLNAARLLYSGIGAPADPEAARLRAWDACELGEREACDLLSFTDEGRLYPPRPEGTGTDPERARQLQEKYCNLGGPQACTARGVALANEAQDTRRFDKMEGALEWLVKGCGMEGTQACQLLFSIASGSIQSCDQDSRAERCLVAGFLHERAADLPGGLAEVVRADASRAAEAFTRACEGGQRAACARLEGDPDARP